MGIESIEVVVDDMPFTIQQFKFKDAIYLEAKTMKILAPALNMLESYTGIDNEMSLDGLGSVLTDILTALVNDDIFEYMKQMMRQTYYTGGQSTFLLNTEDQINKTFHGKTITAFKLLFEIMKANKMAFIEVLGGNGLNITGILKNMNTNQELENK